MYLKVPRYALALAYDNGLTQPSRPATQRGGGELATPIQQPFTSPFRWLPSAKFQNGQPSDSQQAAAQPAASFAPTCFPPW